MIFYTTLLTALFAMTAVAAPSPVNEAVTEKRCLPTGSISTLAAVVSAPKIMVPAALRATEISQLKNNIWIQFDETS
ncbi:hypothetical protein SUNI508_06695 [Seiridium unicorne]|uniref:Uncharacterized protein n=1 Tax=Seiridium unicorne TaxID=138068 RepID=A0ABR2UZX6_9PEZI